jgi:hypothetical protein
MTSRNWCRSGRMISSTSSPKGTHSRHRRATHSPANHSTSATPGQRSARAKTRLIRRRSVPAGGTPARPPQVRASLGGTDPSVAHLSRARAGRRDWVPTSFDCPNMTLTADAHLARVGFMNGRDVEALVEHLEDRGLRLLADGRCADIAVVDAARGRPPSMRLAPPRANAGDRSPVL